MKHRVTYSHIFLYSLLAVFTLLCEAAAQAQPDIYKVSSAPAPAHILIEEFTGLHCSYCPQAHTIANNLTYVAGERLHVMAVHTGSLAAPSGDELDLRTAAGDTFYTWQGAGGMPSGNINRTVYPEGSADSYSLYRSQWAAVTKRLLADGSPAPLNLHVEARLDPAESVIYILVEAYATEAAEKPRYLNVAITENFVPGTQAGSNYRPYLHRHVLCDLATPAAGDALPAGELTQGAYLRRTYAYRLPEKYNNRTPNPANLACLAFVTDENHAIINSGEAPVESPFSAPLDYLQISLPELDKVYAGAIYNVYVVNPSDDTVRSLTFTFDLGGDTRTYTLDNQKVLPKTESVVRLQTDFEAADFQNTNVYTLKLIEANGRAVSSNTLKSSFKAPLTLTAGTVKIAFATDLYGHENTVRLTTETGQEVYAAGPFATGDRRIHTSPLIVLRPGEVYTLRVTDAFRDGVTDLPAAICPSGYPVQVLTAADSVIYQASVGVYGHAVAFCLPGADTSGRDTLAIETASLACGFNATLHPNPAAGQTVLSLYGLEADNEVHIGIYNLQGRLMTRLRQRPQTVPAAGTASLAVPLPLADYPQGFYLVRVMQNGRQQVLKLIVRK